MGTKLNKNLHFDIEAIYSGATAAVQHFGVYTSILHGFRCSNAAQRLGKTQYELVSLRDVFFLLQAN